MTSLAKYFNIDAEENLKGITHKNNILKRNIIAYMALNGECTLSELTRELHISVPTMTKLVQELVDDLIVIDLDQPNMRPIHNIPKNLVYSGSKSNVALTMIAGRILYEKGEYFLDESVEEIYRRAERETKKLIEA